MILTRVSWALIKLECTPEANLDIMIALFFPPKIAFLIIICWHSPIHKLNIREASNQMSHTPTILYKIPQKFPGKGKQDDQL
jgi:hypothetical protein